jgi:hypothetical protein
MPTRIYIVRHGATDLTAEDRFAGSTDVPLSGKGRRQAVGLVERLRKETLVEICASPLDRTVETARIIAQPTRHVPRGGIVAGTDASTRSVRGAPGLNRTSLGKTSRPVHDQFGLRAAVSCIAPRYLDRVTSGRLVVGVKVSFSCQQETPIGFDFHVGRKSIQRSGVSGSCVWPVGS